MKLRLSELRKVCLERPGMFDAFLSAGALEGGEVDISRENFEAIQAKYFKGPLGSVIHSILAPVAAMVDGVLGTNLKDCGDCGMRELKLNALVPGGQPHAAGQPHAGGQSD